MFDNQGRSYFVNHLSKTTTFQDPRIGSVTIRNLFYFIEVFLFYRIQFKQILRVNQILNVVYHIKFDNFVIYHSLSWIRENNLDENDNLELYFNRTFELLGKIENIELKLGGNDIKLTVDNKGEYLELLTKWRFTRGIEDQTKAFLHGFNEVSFSIFSIKQEFCSCSS
jgi:hypothetical protein